MEWFTMAMSSKEVAGFFVRFAAVDGYPLTSMSLHKLMFLAHGHSLSLLNRPLIREPALAWRFGPLYEAVRLALVRFGADDLVVQDGGRKAFKKLGLGPDLAFEDEKMEELLAAVWRQYRSCPWPKLSRMCQTKDGPWDQVWTLQEIDGVTAIPNALIAEYFSSMQPRCVSKETAEA